MAVTSRGHRWWDDSCVSESPRDSRYQRVDEAAFILPQLAPRKGRKAPSPALGVQIENAETKEVEARHPGFCRDGRRTSEAWVIKRDDFDVCPICLSTDELTEEHVPMRALGGKVMTLTCKKCNNKLGSYSEAALRALAVGEVVVEAQSHAFDGFQGIRKATAALRQVPFGVPTMHVTSGDPELLAAISSDKPLDVRYRLIDPFPSGVAILKYAYLAACLWLEEIPFNSEAESFREVLVSVRDGAELSDDVHRAVGRLVQSLVLVESPSHDVGSVALIKSMGTGPAWSFVLGGRLVVPWPFSEVLPTT